MDLYGFLLRLYPASFRNEYGSEMRAMFERRRGQTSGFGALTVWVSAIGEALFNAAAVHSDILRQDLSYAGRMLRRMPGFAATAIVIVALGIGATTAAFSVTDFVLLRPLPFAEPDRLVNLWERTPQYRNELSAANFRDWTGAATVFEHAGIMHSAVATLVGVGDPVRVEGAALSHSVLPTLGVSPIMGHAFTAADDVRGAAGTMILSHGLWQTQFGGDPSVVGRKVLLSDEPYTVIGVMGRDFRYPSPTAAFWIPLRFGEAEDENRNNHWLTAVARLKPGVTLAKARAEMEVIGARSRQQYPADNKDVAIELRRLNDEVPDQSRILLYALCGASACVLLIACANLANLLLARALARRRELAVRTAIGAGRERMVRQLMTESLVLATIGGMLGVATAFAAVPLLTRLVPLNLPLATEPTVDMRVLVFALILSVVTGLAFGLAPVLRLSGEADLGGLRDGSRSGGERKDGTRSALVVVEIVASIVLLVSAGLLMRALLTVQAIAPGFRADGVLTMQTPLPMPKYAKVATREAYYARVLPDILAVPGVTNAAFVSYLPMGRMRGGVWPVAVDGRAVQPHDKTAYLRFVTPGYFATIGVPFRSGRDIAPSDAGDRQFVAVVSDSFVKQYWPDETPASAVGRHITFANDDRVVVGVVGDIRMRGLEGRAEPQVYLSSKQVADNAIIGYVPRALVVRSSVNPEALTASIRSIVTRADATMPVAEVNTLASIVERDTASRATQLRVVGVFALIAFVLAGIGIHGLLSFTVSQRAAEFGVRLALGAQPADILRMVVRRSIKLAVLGVIPGIALAYVAGRSMGSVLAGVAPADATTYASVSLLAVVMTVAGTIMPALRAMRMDPIESLRAE
jgi:putative ABC transport system permease protein